MLTSDKKVTLKFKTAIGRNISTILFMQHTCTINVVHMAVYSIQRLWRNVASTKSSHGYMYKKRNIQEYANSSPRHLVEKTYFPPNIVHVRCIMFNALTHK